MTKTKDRLDKIEKNAETIWKELKNVYEALKNMNQLVTLGGLGSGEAGKETNFKKFSLEEIEEPTEEGNPEDVLPRLWISIHWALKRSKKPTTTKINAQIIAELLENIVEISGIHEASVGLFSIDTKEGSILFEPMVTDFSIDTLSNIAESIKEFLGEYFQDKKKLAYDILVDPNDDYELLSKNPPKGETFPLAGQMGQ